MRISKREMASQSRLMSILEQDVLSHEQRNFVLENFNENAHVEIGRCGAFFTTPELANGLAFEIGSSGKPRKLLDLCAGIGSLAYACAEFYGFSGEGGWSEIVCVEQNPRFVEIGKKILPQATWICGSVDDPDVLDKLREFGTFDVCVSNPPYGVVPSMSGVNPPRYKGAQAHFKVIDIAYDFAAYGVFLLPQSDAGFKYSGVRSYEVCRSENYNRFCSDVGYELEMNCGNDTSHYEGFRNTKIVVEIVLAAFCEHEHWKGHSRKEHVPDPSCFDSNGQMQMFG